MTSFNQMDLSSQRICLFLLQEEENKRLVEKQWREGLHPHLLKGTTDDYRMLPMHAKKEEGAKGAGSNGGMDE